MPLECELNADYNITANEHRSFIVALEGVLNHLEATQIQVKTILDNLKKKRVLRLKKATMPKN